MKLQSTSHSSLMKDFFGFVNWSFKLWIFETLDFLLVKLCSTPAHPSRSFSIEYLIDRIQDFRLWNACSRHSVLNNYYYIPTSLFSHLKVLLLEKEGKKINTSPFLLVLAINISSWHHREAQLLSKQAKSKIENSSRKKPRGVCKLAGSSSISLWLMPYYYSISQSNKLISIVFTSWYLIS